MAADSGSEQRPTHQDFAYILDVARQRFKEYPTSDNDAAYKAALRAFSERVKELSDEIDAATT